MRKHSEINMGQKSAICLHKDKTPKATHKSIAFHFNKLWNTDFFRCNTVRDSLEQKTNV